MAQLLHQTFTLPVLLNEGEQVPTCTQTKAINNLAVVECSRGMVHKYYGGRTNAALVLPPYPPHEIVLHLVLYT